MFSTSVVDVLLAQVPFPLYDAVIWCPPWLKLEVVNEA
jgi:hypothetical protein